MNEKFFILIQISLKFVPKRPIDNKPALVQVMDWRRPLNAYVRHSGEVSFNREIG